MFWLQVIPAGIYFLALLLIPESPRYLVLKGRDAEAGSRADQAVRRRPRPRARSREIRASLAADHHRPRFSDLIDKSTGKIRPIVWAGIGLAVFQQLVGINIVFYYGAVLWQSVGFSERRRAADQHPVGRAVDRAPACSRSSLVDKIGRKPLLLIGSAAWR